MKNALIAAVATCASLFTGGSAVAADQLDTDVTCLALSLLMAGDDDAELSQTGWSQAMYMAGRLDGRISEKDLQDRVVGLITGDDESWIATSAPICSGMLNAKCDELTRMAERLGAASEAQN